MKSPQPSLIAPHCGDAAVGEPVVQVVAPLVRDDRVVERAVPLDAGQAGTCVR